MPRKAIKKTRFLDANQDARPTDVPDEEVQLEFEEASRVPAGARRLRRKLNSGPGATITGGDLDAAWDRGDVGEEAVGGTVSTPDQDIVEELGQAAGLTYEDNEPLRTTEKVEQRDRKRWEFNPASSEDFQERALDNRPSKVAEQSKGSPKRSGTTKRTKQGRKRKRKNKET